jgi:hypothetical protein
LIYDDGKMYGIRIRSLPTLTVGLKKFFPGNRIGYFKSVHIEVQDFCQRDEFLKFRRCGGAFGDFSNQD